MNTIGGEMRCFGVVALCAALAVSSLSCSVNVLETFANKNTDEALYEDAKMLINQGDYTGALNKIALIHGALATDRKTIRLTASAYGGICGLNLITLAKDLGNMGSARLLPFLTNEFKGGTGAKIDACRIAEDLIESIGTISQRTSDENMFLVLISFAKIGNILSLYTDSNQDGVPDAGLNPCTHTRSGRPPAAGAGWYDSDLRELGSGITIAVANITAVSGTVNLGNASLASINSGCATLTSTFNASYNFCSITDPSAFTSAHLQGIMAIIKESSVVGIGTNCSGDISACNCGP